MKVRLKNNQPNSAQRKALLKEVNKIIEDVDRQVILQIGCILRFDYGFGQERLEKFFEKLAKMRAKTTTHYEVENFEIPDICEIKLRDSGIDVEKLFKG